MSIPYPSAKVAVIKAYEFQMRQKDGPGGDPTSAHNYSIGKQMELGKILAAVEKQDQTLAVAVQVAHAPLSVISVEDVEHLIARLFAVSVAGEQFQDRTLVKMLSLARTAVTDWHSQQYTGAPMEITEVCDKAGIQRSHWYRDGRPWKRIYNRMLDVLSGYRRHGMKPVHRVVDEINERYTEAA